MRHAPRAPSRPSQAPCSWCSGRGECGAEGGYGERDAGFGEPVGDQGAVEAGLVQGLDDQRPGQHPGAWGGWGSVGDELLGVGKCNVRTSVAMSRVIAAAAMAGS